VAHLPAGLFLYVVSGVVVSGGTDNGESLSWAAWVIARLGGWSGYASQRPPVPSTMSRGLKKFKTIKEFRHVALE